MRKMWILSSLQSPVVSCRDQTERLLRAPRVLPDLVVAPAEPPELLVPRCLRGSLTGIGQIVDSTRNHTDSFDCLIYEIKKRIRLL